MVQDGSISAVSLEAPAASTEDQQDANVSPAQLMYNTFIVPVLPLLSMTSAALHNGIARFCPFLPSRATRGTLFRRF